MYLIPRNMDIFRSDDSYLPFWSDGLFERFFKPYQEREIQRDASWNPPMDFIDDHDQYILYVDAPGMKKEDINVNFTEGTLFIEGKRAHEKEVNNGDNVRYLFERRCGSFKRHFHLHVDVNIDEMKADYSNGILKVTVPKRTETAVRKIPVEIM